MGSGFSLTDEQMKAFEAILSKKNVFSSHLTTQEVKYDVFEALGGNEKVLAEVKLKLPLGFKGQALVSCDPSNLMDVFVAMVKFAVQSGYAPVLVLFMNNYVSVRKRLIEEGIKEDCFIVDVSKSISPVNEEDNLVFTDSLRNLTQIQIKLLNILSTKKDVAFIFDSVSVLDYYHEEDTILKFVYSLTKLLRKNNSAGLYVSTDLKLSQKVGQFFDEHLELKKYL
jgi:hypothetical protein